MKGKLSELLRELLEANEEVTQAQLANAMGLAPQGALQTILVGEILNVPDRRLRGAAELLGVSASRLINARDEDLRGSGREDEIKDLSSFLVVSSGGELLFTITEDEPEMITLCQAKAIKVLDESTRRIGAYATIWGELDCDGDRMTKGAIEPYVNSSGVPLMLWMHGLDPEMKGKLPGEWDKSSFRIDDTGLWVEGNLHNTDTGNTAWMKISQAGSFGLSVGSIWYLVKRRENLDGSKDIIDWALFEISIMEGGKQCVPSAQRNVKSGELSLLFAGVAAKFNIDYHTSTTKGVLEMDIDNEELKAIVERRVDAALAAKAEAERKEQERRKEIEVKAQEIAADAIAKNQIEWDEKRTELEKDLRQKWEDEQKELARKKRPRVPSHGVIAPDTPAIKIEVLSPYDRLNTFDLAIRYQVMKSYGRQPSNRFWRALATRAVKMSRQEDTLYIKNGHPVKVPALDWVNLIPSNLDLEEVDGELFGVKARGNVDRAEDNVTPRGVKQLHEIAVKANELVYSYQSGAGDEWVPTLMTAELWRTIRLNAAVMNLFTQFDMPSNPYDYPIESTDPVIYKVGETTDQAQLILTGGPFNDSKPGTGKKTFDAGKMGAISFWSEEMAEDSIIAVEPQFRDQYGLAMAHGIDEILISGDQSTGTANISFDGTTITTSSRFLTIDGLRHEPLITTNTDGRSGGTLTADDFRSTLSLMGAGGKFGVNPVDLAFIMDTATYHKSVGLDDVRTLDAMGAAATIITGQLASIWGIPVVVSEDYALTASNGKIHNSTGNTFGSFLAVNRRGVMMGWRRRPRVRVVGIPGADARFIVGSARFDIQFKEAGMVALTYNLTV